ncbi:MAG: hypothetical protein V5A14_03280 [Desulfohalobiaceae bacterium]
MINIEGIFLLGDICAPLPLEDILGAEVAEKVWFIPGDRDSERQEWMQHLVSMWDRNLHASITEAGGYRVAGLGGVFREEVWHPRKGTRWDTRYQLAAQTSPRAKFRNWLPLRHWSSIFLEDYEGLLNPARADILITHEAPSCHTRGFAEVDELASLLNVNWILHGHQDTSYVERVFLEDESIIQAVGLARQNIHIIV